MSTQPIFDDDDFNAAISELLARYSAVSVLCAFRDAAEACFEHEDGMRGKRADGAAAWSAAQAAIATATDALAAAEAQTAAAGVTIQEAVDLDRG